MQLLLVETLCFAASGDYCFGYQFSLLMSAVLDVRWTVPRVVSTDALAIGFFYFVEQRLRQSGAGAHGRRPDQKTKKKIWYRFAALPALLFHWAPYLYAGNRQSTELPPHQVSTCCL